MIYSIRTTCASEKEAETIAKTLLDKKLIACANIFPVRSIYRWKDKLEDEQEFFLIVKTTHPQVAQEIEKLHSYETPCIVTDQVEVNDAYENWLAESLQ